MAHVFVIDESVSPELVKILKARRQKAICSTVALRRAAPDDLVAKYACDMNAIVVTENGRHFVRYLSAASGTRLRGVIIVAGQCNINLRLIDEWHIILAELRDSLKTNRPSQIELAPEKVTIRRRNREFSPNTAAAQKGH